MRQRRVASGQPRQNREDICGGAPRRDPPRPVAGRLPVAAQVERIGSKAARLERLEHGPVKPRHIEVEVWPAAPGAAVDEQNRPARRERDASPDRERMTVGLNGEALRR